MHKVEQLISQSSVAVCLNSLATILYIDDNEENLLGFETVFSKHFMVYTAQNTSSGYEIMKQNPIGVVLIDYKMPEEDGVSFVERIKDEFHDTIFVLVSAWADLDVIVKAINMNCFYSFIQKPWNHNELNITLKNAVEAFQSRVENKRLNQILVDQNTKLQEAIKREKEANSVKNIFLQNISHEIRTPLNSIIGFSNLIKDKAEDESIKTFANIVTQSGYQLLSVIHGILEASLIFNNQLTLNSSSFCVGTLVEKVIDDTKLNSTKSIEVINQVNKGLLIENDKLKVEKILCELICNAIKFTENGSVTVECSECAKKELVIKIKDTGIGIEPEKLSQIFQPFRQSDETSTRNYNGNGIGLFIAKSYTEFLGGRIWVESKLGVGSTFYISLKQLS